MRRYKKVSGERVVAALIDYIAMYILGLVVAIVPMLFIGFDNFLDMFIGSAFEATGDVVSEDLILYTMITTYAGVLIGVIYFVLIPWRMNGQTIGKKIMKLKAINEYGENPNLWQHFIRAVQNWNTYFTALIGWIIAVNYLLYSVTSIFVFVVSIAFLVSFIMMLAREDGRGLHDMIAGTYVVSCNENLDKEFAETTAQMGDWVEVEDKDDDWDRSSNDKDNNKDDDEWSF